MKQVFLAFLAVAFISSCSDDLEVPPCVDALSESLRSDFCAEGADLTIWDFNGREVYCFNWGTCEKAKAVIYDENCNELCTLSSAPGQDQCEGISWANNASNRRLVYTY